MSFDDILRARKGPVLEQAQRLGPAFYQNGEIRTPGPQHEPVPVGKARNMALFPRKYSEALEYNQKINLCCRHMENVTGQMYKTNPNLAGPDLLIATCTCGRKHYRLQVGEN